MLAFWKTWNRFQRFKGKAVFFCKCWPLNWISGIWQFTLKSKLEEKWLIFIISHNWFCVRQKNRARMERPIYWKIELNWECFLHSIFLDITTLVTWLKSTLLRRSNALVHIFIWKHNVYKQIECSIIRKGKCLKSWVGKEKRVALIESDREDMLEARLWKIDPK